MGNLATYVAGGLAVALAVDFFAPLPGAGRAFEMVGRANFTSELTATQVDRALKGDRLIAVSQAPRVRPTIAAVEIVGLGNAAVVYRDREGRELFRTDPVSNATVVAEGVVLPAVTIRYSETTPVGPIPVKAPLGDGKAPVGCELPVSPLAGPGPGTRLGRCIVEHHDVDDAVITVAWFAQSTR